LDFFIPAVKKTPTNPLTMPIHPTFKHTGATQMQALAIHHGQKKIS
jgi:hypothetical protein